MRTPDEIATQMKAIEKDDFLGFGREVLMSYLPWSHIQPFLKEGVTEDQWTAESRSPVEAGVDYLKFAIGKALDHRGISAGRSVEKLRQYAWLAEREDVVQAMDDAAYENYGVPKLMAFGSGFDVPTEWAIPAHDAARQALLNMSKGLPCTPNCMEGCGQ